MLTRLSPASLLAARAEAVEFQVVGYAGEAVSGRDACFQVGRETFLQFDDDPATGANQVMVMSVVAISEQFEARAAGAKVKTFHQAQALEQMHGTIYRGQVAVPRREFREHFPDGHGAGVATEHGENGLTRGRDAARATAQLLGQSR
jgi:hypothetical protein